MGTARGGREGRGIQTTQGALAGRLRLTLRRVQLPAFFHRAPEDLARDVLLQPPQPLRLVRRRSRVEAVEEELAR
eukprot:818091-Prymnesium_polylepis.1